MNLINLRAMSGGAYAPEDARQVDDDEPSEYQCYRCGLTREEDRRAITPCRFHACPFQDEPKD